MKSLAKDTFFPYLSPEQNTVLSISQPKTKYIFVPISANSAKSVQFSKLKILQNPHSMKNLMHVTNGFNQGWSGYQKKYIFFCVIIINVPGNCVKYSMITKYLVLKSVHVAVVMPLLYIQLQITLHQHPIQREGLCSKLHIYRVICPIQVSLF